MAQEKFDIALGGQALTLEKSSRFIAVKPRPGMDGRAKTTLASISAHPAQGAERLGGFQLVELGEAEQAGNADAQLERLRHDPSIAIGSHVYHTSDDGVPFVPTGTLFIAFRLGLGQQQQERLLEDQHLQILEARENNEFIARVTPESPNPVKVAATLQASGEVDICEPELATPGQVMSFVPPSGGMLADQWHLENRGHHRGTSVGFRAGADARVVGGWRALGSLGSPQALIAVIDDGFDLRHPDLSGAGKVVHSWDFTRRTSDPSPGETGEDWHGTACAGVATGRTAGTGIYGAAPGATLMPVRWGPDLSDSQIESWFGYVADRGAWVVSCSWSAAARNFPLSTRAKRAIQKCATAGRGGKGCVVVFAAGNENRDINDPGARSVNGFAAHPDAIAVAASTSIDTRSSYSNFGDEIAVCAPSNGSGGWGILTCDVTGTRTVGGVTVDLGYDPGDYTRDFGGTSSACPLVAGVCGLVLTANPDLTAAEVKKLLMSTARRIGSAGSYPNGHSPLHGAGCVDAEAAIHEAQRRRGAAIAGEQAVRAESRAA